MKFLKPINDGDSINDKRVFILETEETILMYHFTFQADDDSYKIKTVNLPLIIS
tara:strand:- start:481 stop:642 length:162 start_codon:yes stop_codon:yes gene_type:complete